MARLKHEAESDPVAAELLEQVLDDKIAPNAAAVEAGARTEAAA